MPEVIALDRVLQVGFETTSGVAVPATKRLQTLQWTSDIAETATEYAPQGDLFPTVFALAQAMTKGRIGGAPSFGEIVYPLSMALGSATITTPGGGTNARQWRWNIAGTNYLNPKSATVEIGDAQEGEQVPFSIVDGLTLALSRQQIQLSGSAFGGQTVVPFTMTTGLTPPEATLVPVVPNEIDVFIDPTFGALGTTKQLRSFDGQLELSGTQDQAWPLNSSLASYGAIAPKFPKATLDMTAAMDAQGQALLSALRANTRQYVRINATGPLIEATIHYQITIDMAINIVAPGAIKNVNGIFCRTFNGRIADDSAWGQAMQITVVNKLASL